MICFAELKVDYAELKVGLTICKGFYDFGYNWFSP